MTKKETTKFNPDCTGSNFLHGNLKKIPLGMPRGINHRDLIFRFFSTSIAMSPYARDLV